MSTHTKETILAILETNDKAVCRALVVLFERQTRDEQASENTQVLNGMGFNGRDAGFGSSLAKQIMDWETAPDRRYPNPLSGKQLEMGRRMVRKYAGQLAKVANAKAQQAVTV